MSGSGWSQAQCWGSANLAVFYVARPEESLLETDATRISALLVGLPGVVVLGVAE